MPASVHQNASVKKSAELNWILASAADPGLERSLARELAVTPFVASLLCRRGLHDATLAREFLEPRLKSLGDPLVLPNMRAAIERILAAVERKERIVLYGDYDVDGVTSLALFARMLRALGAEPRTFLPVRMDEGYGLSAESVHRCMTTLQPRLLIALDCGTSSAAEIASIQAAGADVIVFDHHEIKSALPACTLVNPKLGETHQYLCSVGIVFKACHALLKMRPLGGFDLRDYLDLVALGTVADIVPLVGENRIFVQRGLLQLERTRWVGLRALMNAAAVRAPLSPVDIGYRLGPRLNAAGRLGTAEDALQLLLTENPSEARTLATGLDRQNQERQAVEEETMREAKKAVALSFVPARDAAIIAGESGWHPGVLGIVASRIAKHFHRPAFVVGFDENGVGKGSGRSIEGFSLVNALAQCGACLEKFGGHEMAAGLTVRQERFAEFQRAFLDCARSRLTDDDLQPRLRLDSEISLADLDMDFLAHHDRLQPFGIGNFQPLLLARGVKPEAAPRVLKEKHLLFKLRQDGAATPAIYFNSAEMELPRPPWDIAFRIERNEYRETVSLQVQIHAIRAAQ